MPQANIFILGFPITIGVGLLVLFTAMPLMVFVFEKLLTSFETSIMELIQIL
jgi:flagellar biosynthetic protein FliR